ncbi:B12-binding domain-containing radical SAM protein [Aureispira anguillae]|uniref:B12-binding domain-containing radical SAM protein n=1 Tax=Aureispira anguillae TaxID=2864201 RepID=UPI00222FDE26|nr:radical SAM protein [Aureispira anguillae]
MNTKVLLITPPFTQLNTPYPATAYLKGFLNTQQIDANQADLGIETILELFSRQGLSTVFEIIAENFEASELSADSQRILHLAEDYLQTISPTIAFLQHKNPTLAHSICSRTYLPEAGRFQAINDLDWAFGTMGTQDKARHLATLYLEDLGDLIKECIDPHFGFSRYAERLGRTATHFDPIQEALEEENSLVSDILTQLLEYKIEDYAPTVVCLSVPFPGNLFGALKCGQYIKENHPDIKLILGGGYANTELRSLSDERLFDYIDYVCLDDGEAPLLFLLEHLAGQREAAQLKRVFAKVGGVVSYYNNAIEKDIPQREVGTPDYSDLPLEEYLSVIEIVNPMHRLWSDGRWNKLTLAHGCYWGKCSFCDISLDYIQRYEPVNASILCDRIETIIEQTGQNGFHFVDEAAPPALMRDLALEIIRRKITVVWWTNIRFEKSFTYDLCQLLKASGCIAVSGGLEVASDRLLKLMKKGVTVAQVARVCDAFTQAGIMVHAYLMYGFPTQTEQETIDSLEMVRQLFEQGVLQSGFWHQFAMTAHSPVGLVPEEYMVERIGPNLGGFADNDLYHEDRTGAEHELFAQGLKTALFNYMHGTGFEIDLAEWFDFETPTTSIASDYIYDALNVPIKPPRPNALVIWLGNSPSISFFEDENQGTIETIAALHFFTKQNDWVMEMDAELGNWLFELLEQLALGEQPISTFKQLKTSFEAMNIGTIEELIDSSIWAQLNENGLLIC